MDIIFVQGKAGKTRIVQLGGLGQTFLISALILLVASVVYLSGSLSSENEIAPQQYQFQSQTQIETLKQEINKLATQKEELELARVKAESDVSVLTRRVGKMQAHIIRLEALGNRLSEMAGLEEEEFDFAHDPAQGGPLLDEGNYPEISTSSVSDFLLAVDEMNLALEEKTSQLEFIESFYIRNQVDKQSTVAGRPIQKGWVSSFFGKRTDPFTGKPAYHSGLDLAGKQGSDVYAVADGIVTWAGKRWAYGQMVELDHGKSYTTRYGHAEKVLVKVGQRVKKGQLIATMGSSGRSTGPHVHFEVRIDGKAVDPVPYIRKKG